VDPQHLHADAGGAAVLPARIGGAAGGGVQLAAWFKAGVLDVQPLRAIVLCGEKRANGDGIAISSLVGQLKMNWPTRENRRTSHLLNELRRAAAPLLANSKGTGGRWCTGSRKDGFSAAAGAGFLERPAHYGIVPCDVTVCYKWRYVRDRDYPIFFV